MFKNVTALILALCVTLSAFGGTVVLFDNSAQAQEARLA